MSHKTIKRTAICSVKLTAGLTGGTGWDTHYINSIDDDLYDIIEINAGFLTLPAGRWLIEAISTARECNSNALAIEKDGVKTIGVTHRNASSTFSSVSPSVRAIINSSGSNTIKIRQYMQARTNQNMGFAFFAVNTYLEILIQEL